MMHQLRFLICLCMMCSATAVFAKDEIIVMLPQADAPFSDPSATDQGLIAEILQNAFADSPDELALQIAWSKPERVLEDYMIAQSVDMGLIWGPPDCQVPQPASRFCDQIYVSDPLFETFVLLFTRAEAQFVYETKDDLRGKTICYAQHPWSSLEPSWVAENGALIIAKANLPACFTDLVAGRVDAVAANEFRGVRQLFNLELTKSVVPLTKPLASVSAHLGIARYHWRATTHLYRVNDGLAQLRQSGAYGAIVSRHVRAFWSAVER